MSQLLFERVERKYLIDDRQFCALMPALKPHVEEDKYPDYMVHNLYYDTENYFLIRTSLEKPTFKEKLRLRCYGTPAPNGNCFVELKKKYKGIVYKRRLELPLTQAYSWLEKGHLPLPEDLTCQEITWARNYWDLSPKMILIYRRTAYHFNENPNLRITFDSEILWRNSDFDLTLPVFGSELLPSGQHLIELKVPDAMPIWLGRLFSELEIFPHSYSKYGQAYLMMMKNRTKKKEM